MESTAIKTGVIVFGVELEVFVQVLKPDAFFKDVKDPQDRKEYLGVYILKKHKELFGTHQYQLTTEIAGTKYKSEFDQYRYRVPENKGGLNFTSWSLTKDNSLTNCKGPPGSLTCGFEFVSPVMRIGPPEAASPTPDEAVSNHAGEKEVTRFYDFLKDIGLQVVVNDQCSTHVHLSPELRVSKITPSTSKIPQPGGGLLNTTSFHFASSWTPARILRMFQFTLLFESAIESHIPSEQLKQRHQGGHAKKYSLAPNFNGKEKSLDDLSSQKSRQEILEWLKTLTAGDKKFSWNYNYLTAGETGDTIEFRLPPGSSKASEAIGWIKLARAIVLAACNGPEPRSMDPVQAEKEIEKYLK